MKFKYDTMPVDEKAKLASQQPQNFAQPQGQKPHVKVVFCIPGREFTANFLQSWTKLCNALYMNGISFVLSNTYSPVVYYARSAALRAHVLRGRHQKPFNEEITYDYLMWIDSDIVWEPQDFFALLERMEKNKHIDLLSGIYMMQDGHHTTYVDKWDEDYFQNNGSFQFLTKEDLERKKLEPETIKNGGLCTGVYIGFGWLMVRFGVFEQLEYPFFKPIFHELKGGAIYDFSSEDASFFLEMKEKGVTLYVDPNIIVGHEKMVVIK
jgi:hypothetical protein